MERRDFLKISGLAAAAATLPCGISTLSAKNPEGSMARNIPGVGLLGYGCMRWPLKDAPDGGKIIDQEAVNDLVDKAMANGVNYYDTSPAYLSGQSERATAIALRRYPRDKWILATKLSNFANWDYDNSVTMFRRSLEIFDTDHVDYYLLHAIHSVEDFNKRYESTGILNFLLAEREAGHIRNLGFSFHGSNEDFEAVLALDGKYHWDFVQIQMNYLDWRQEGNAEYLYGRLEEKNIPVVIMEPLRGGALSTIPAVLAEKLKSQKPDQSIASWAFRFAGSFPKVLTVLSGMTYMDHLQDNLNTYCNLEPLSESEFSLLEEIASEIARYPLIPCTGCQYCMPCPYGIDIPGIFAFYNRTVNEGSYVKTPVQQGYARLRRRYLAGYGKAVEKERQADHCISCGKCARACPQRIPIPRKLKDIDDYVEKLKREEL